MNGRTVGSDGTHVPGYTRSPFNSGNAISARDRIARLRRRDGNRATRDHAAAIRYLRSRYRIHILAADLVRKFCDAYSVQLDEIALYKLNFENSELLKSGKQKLVLRRKRYILKTVYCFD